MERVGWGRKDGEGPTEGAMGGAGVSWYENAPEHVPVLFYASYMLYFKLEVGLTKRCAKYSLHS